MKITISIDCPGIDHRSVEAAVLLHTVQDAWERGYTEMLEEANRNAQVSPLMKTSEWYYEISKEEPLEKPALPEKIDVLELKRLLMRLWINSPILMHGLLLYREAAKSETTRSIANEVMHETAALRKMASDVVELPFGD